jgi:hypothetical protein
VCGGIGKGGRRFKTVLSIARYIRGKCCSRLVGICKRTRSRVSKRRGQALVKGVMPMSSIGENKWESMPVGSVSAMRML